jgi:hypothetical protein
MLAGNSKTVTIETTSFYGRSLFRTIPTNSFLRTNSAWPPKGNKWWLSAHYQAENGRVETLLFESFAGNVRNENLFNRLLVGELNAVKKLDKV